jgi:hypothetical protein
MADDRDFLVYDTTLADIAAIRVPDGLEAPPPLPDGG